MNDCIRCGVYLGRPDRLCEDCALQLSRWYRPLMEVEAARRKAHEKRKTPLWTPGKIHS